MDEEKIAAVMAQMGRPRRVPRPHRHFDGDYAALARRILDFANAAGAR